MDETKKSPVRWMAKAIKLANQAWTNKGLAAAQLCP